MSELLCEQSDGVLRLTLNRPAQPNALSPSLVESARFRLPGRNFELGVGTRRLSRLVGTDVARDMLIALEPRTSQPLLPLRAGLA